MKESKVLKTFGANIRRLRLKQGLNRAALAGKSGLSANYIGTLERGKQNPSLKTLAKLAVGLGCSMAETCKGIK